MKVLIISQHLFPMQTPRAHRTTELAKEFSRKGHDVIVYAVLGKYDYSQFERVHNVKVKNIKLKWQIHPYNSDGDYKRNLFDRIVGRILRKIEFPDVEFMFRMKRIIQQEKNTDLLISVANPHPIHWGCAKAKLKLQHDFPSTWIADCGDPFMKNGSGNKHLSYFSKFEKSFCFNADFISVPHERAIDAYYPDFRSKIKVIPQGFQFELNKKTDATITNPVVSFAYAGVFLSDIRNPTTFLEFLSTINIDFKFYIFTSHTELVDDFRTILKDKMIIRKPIPRAELLEELATMDFLLNFENLNTPTAVPSKLIDYSIVGRPILSVNQLDIKEKIVVEFLNKDYHNAFKIENINQYHISNVVDSFINLVEV